MCRLSRNPGALTSRIPQGHVGLFRSYFNFLLFSIIYQQSIYSYICDTSHVSRVHVAGIYVVPFPMINVLCFYITISRIMCAVPISVVFYCTMLSYLPSMLLIYVYILTGFVMVPVAPIVSVVFFVYFTCTVFLSPEFAVIINSYVHFLLPDITFLSRFTF
jgi:hypothetical protein